MDANLPSHIPLIKGLENNSQFTLIDIASGNWAWQKASRLSFQKIIWVKNGSGFHSIDDKVLAIEPNSFYIINKGKVYSLIDDGKITEGMVISFSHDFLPSIQQNFNDNFYSSLNGYIGDIAGFSLNASEILEFEVLVEQLFVEYTQKKGAFGNENIIQHLLLALLLRLERKSRELLTQRVSSTEKKEKQTYFKFLELIEKHFFEQHNVEFYAQELGIRRRKLSADVKLFNGKPAKMLIQERVILEAKRMLTFTNNNLKDIAYQLGFETPTYFSRTFKKHTGYTPLEYQRR